MKTQLMAAGLTLVSLMLPFKALAANFTGLYVLGDSLSDTGNVFNLTIDPNTGIGLPPPPYFQGRFTNGPIWIDELAQRLNLDSPTTFIQVANGATPQGGINFAFGGATTTAANTINSNLFGLPQQVAAFQTVLNTNQQPVDPDGLYVVWLGANDYLPTQSLDFVPFTTPFQTLENISNTIQGLASVGVKNFIVPNLPNLGNTPRGLGGGELISNNLNQLTQEHNAGLSALLAGFSQNLGLNIIGLDVNSLFSDPVSLGFTNFTEPCLNTITQTLCNNPNEYLYWDFIHPTSSAHSILADAAFAALQPKSVPESGSVWGLLAFGGLGLVGIIKGQKKKFASNRANPALDAQSSHTMVES
jgi:phospholipase/lecithinase/hemolysin